MFFSRITGCPVYMVHPSVKEGVDFIAKAKGEGINVTAETCVQYFALNTNNTEKVLCKANPPIGKKRIMINSGRVSQME